MRIGLFGGTFNPIHRGHLHIAHGICLAFPLDRICLIPCAIPPHKEVQGLVGAQDRLEMVRLAMKNSKRLWVSDVELQRKGPSYSIDTVEYFLSQSRPGDELFMLVGLDAFLELDTWKDYLNILRLIPLIVMPRPIAGNSALADGRKQVADLVRTKLSGQYSFDSFVAAYVHPSLMPIYYSMQLQPLDISSTKVRKRIGKGESIDSMVSEEVAAYINDKGLYR